MNSKITFFASLLLGLFLFTQCKTRQPHRETRKPVVYIYPQKKQPVTIELNYKGVLRATYPLLKNNRWEMVADVDGKLTDPVSKKQFNYLFYDGVSNANFTPITEGFCVKNDTLIQFLERSLTCLGLNSTEQNDMISYWLPELNEKQFSLIRFKLNDACNEISILNISPKPTTEIRIMIEFMAVDSYRAVKQQKLVELHRKGFTVVEWGGVNLSQEKLTF